MKAADRTAHTDLRTLLQRGDPLAERPQLSPDEALAIRQVVLGAVRSERSAGVPWPGAVPIAAALITVIAAGVAIGFKRPPADPPRAAAVSADSGDRRQVQFSIPGGTRIIWTIDPDFELQGGTP